MRTWHAIFIFTYIPFVFVIYAHVALTEPMRSIYLRWLMWVGIAIGPIIAIIICQLHKAVKETDEIERKKEERRQSRISNCNCD